MVSEDDQSQKARIDFRQFLFFMQFNTEAVHDTLLKNVEPLQGHTQTISDLHSVEKTAAYKLSQFSVIHSVFRRAVARSIDHMTRKRKSGGMPVRKIYGKDMSKQGLAAN